MTNWRHRQRHECQPHGWRACGRGSWSGVRRPVGVRVDRAVSARAPSAAARAGRSAVLARHAPASARAT